MFYFYIILSDTGYFYAGSRSSKYANPNELLVTYNTSSNIVHSMMNSGINFEIVTIKTFEKPEQALKYEKDFLVKNCCSNSDSWLNCHNGESISPFGSPNYTRLMVEKHGVTNANQLPEVKAKVSKALSGSINVWDETMKMPVRITANKYDQNKDRYWHFSSKQYIDKYDKGRSTKKPNGSTLYQLFDQHDNLALETKYFKKYCEEHNLPYETFANSARKNTRIYVKKPPNNKDWIIYTGWYAKRINSTQP